MTLKSAKILPIHAKVDQHYREWLISPGGYHRDSDLVDECNYEVVRDRLAEVDPEGNDHAILRFGHWAVGWVEEFVVRPGSECERVALEIQAALDSYPILDEMRYSEMEYAANCEESEETN